MIGPKWGNISFMVGPEWGNINALLYTACYTFFPISMATCYHFVPQSDEFTSDLFMWIMWVKCSIVPYVTMHKTLQYIYNKYHIKLSRGLLWQIRINLSHTQKYRSMVSFAMYLQLHIWLWTASGLSVYLRKLSEHSVATALARRVFPVPGAP